MHVGFLVYGSLDRRSGGYLYDRELADRFGAGGDRVSVVSLPVRAERSYPRALAGGLSSTVRRRLETLDVDVLLQDELCHPVLVGLNRRLDVPYPIVAVVHHLRSSEPHPAWRGRLYRRIERRYLRSVDAVVCTSETTRETVRALAGPQSVATSLVAYPGGDRLADTFSGLRGGRDRGDSDFGGDESGDERDAVAGTDDDERDAVASNAFDAEAGTVSPAGIRERAREGPLRIVAVGRVTPRKNLDGLVEGLARIPGGWLLTVVGDDTVDPGYTSVIRETVEELGITGRVTFTGRVADETLVDLLAGSHLFAMPSRYEGIGIAYVEAMGFGLPVVATTAGGASEIVQHRVNGFLVAPDDPGQITDAVAPLCLDRDRLERMGCAARETYLAHPTWDETASRVRAFLAGLIG